MQFRNHSELAGRHAFLSASNYHWINYSPEKLDSRYLTALAAQRGTDLHAFANEAIRLKIKLPRDKKTLSMYVNDAIGYRMTPELTLFYSMNCFGTADTISFRKGELRIHDLKTGTIPSSFHQLEVYAALFCLEYGFAPFELDLIELRIYQSDEIRAQEADRDVIMHIIETIKSFDKRINELREAEL